jgi:hypothetical protein
MNIETQAKEDEEAEVVELPESFVLFVPSVAVFHCCWLRQHVQTMRSGAIIAEQWSQS